MSPFLTPPQLADSPLQPLFSCRVDQPCGGRTIHHVEPRPPTTSGLSQASVILTMAVVVLSKATPLGTLVGLAHPLPL